MWEGTIIDLSKGQFIIWQPAILIKDPWLSVLASQQVWHNK